MRERDLPADCLAKILAEGQLGPSVSLPGESEPEPEPDTPTKFLDSSVSLVGGVLTIVLPLKTASEVNARDWRKRSRRSNEAWGMVSRTVGPHLALLAPFAEAYHADRALCVRFVRFGGRRLDKGNLPSATKACEDACAFMLGASDGDSRWRPSWEQSPGGAAGVVVEIEVFR